MRIQRDPTAAFLLFVTLGLPTALRAQPRDAISFARVELATDFTCEGATFGDLDRDGKTDVIAGPYWYQGPDFKVKHELYPPKAFDPAHYSDHFFDWVRDLDGDGWPDILMVGFPGQEAFWFRNPLAASDRDAHWQRNLVWPTVDNESPAFTDLTGDGRPELVCQSGGRFGWVDPDARDPRAPWQFHRLSEDLKIGNFVHGLGVGDVDGDGRRDVLWKEGWFAQPKSLAGDPVWPFHAFRFSDREGGAQMFTHDVDQDGDADVITSLAAHHFGLSWFEQVKTDGAITFVEHRLMDAEPSDNTYGVRFGELHALDLADVNGDGALDIVTGKRWWSHGNQGDPEPGGKPVVYWFEWRRSNGQVEFVPHLADDASGVGVQLVTGDVNGDHLIDVVIGNKRGVNVLLQRRAAAAADPPASPQDPPTLDFESGDLRGWTATGEAFAQQPIAGDTVTARSGVASLNAGQFWIGGYERLGDAPQGTLTSNPFVVAQPWASFLVAGGTYTPTRVEIELADEARVIFKTCGANHESLQRVVVDLRAYLGRKIRIRLVDESDDRWGHISFDDFTFHPQPPVIEHDPSLPPVRPFDEVRFAGLTPQEAVRAMTVPEGFEVDLIAAEPDLHQPVAMAIDDRGRLWVAEAFAYPRRRDGERGPDDIVVFEDADHDGRFEKRTVFLEGLNLVSGLEVGFGGVWIGAAPYLMFVPDRDQDLVPDGKPQILLDGWAWQDTHETLNTFTWGPDGWLYGCHGVFTHSLVGKPGASEAERTPINAGVWRYHPTRHEFEVFAWGTSNPWGLDFDAHGQAFITACVIPHLYHVIQGGRYQRQSGGHFDPYVFADIATIADHRHFLGPDSHSANLRSNSAGGGHAHCGLMLYLGGAFPEPFRDGLFFDNIHGNRINHDRVVRSGSGFSGQHAQDLLLANDAWFRGINLKYGPEGSVYLIDWYDKQACHDSQPETWDRTNGRLYRLSYGPHRARAVDLGRLASAELIDLLADQNEWYVRHARRLLQERAGDRGTIAALTERLAREPSEIGQLRTLWALHGAGGLGETLAQRAMQSEHEYVRAWAIQLALEDRKLEPKTMAQLERLAESDPSPVVRLYLAAALQRLPVDARFEIAKNLARHAGDASDHNLPLMLWYGVEPLVAADVEHAIELIDACQIERVSRFLVRRLAAEAKRHEALVRVLADPRHAAARGWMLDEALNGLADQRGLTPPKGWSALHAQLATDADATVRERARSLSLAFGEAQPLPDLRRTLADRAADPAARLQALDALVRAKDGETVAVLKSLLDDATLRGVVIRACAVFDDAPTAAAILECYRSLGTDERRDALNTLSSRASYAAQLLDAVRADRVPRRDVGAFVVRKIESLGDAKITATLHELWGQVRATSESATARIAALKAVLTQGELARADAPRGRQLFARTCQPCHTLFGTGGKVGPELTGSNRADLDYLLSNVVDPNAVVGKDYLATLAWMRDGRLVTGIQRGSTESSITLQAENETVVLARADIEDVQLSDLSTMPEGLLDAFAPDEIRDLVAYLRSPVQVPLLATAGEQGRFFDARTLAGWQGNPACWSVADGEIVGRTQGLAKNEFLISDLELANFKLSVEVKLAGDEGNSGIQFHSRATGDGEVAGYQADVGPGWWGKLYEEQGRGLLSDRSGEAHVKRGDWNRYQVEAIGHHVRTWLNGELCVDLEDPSGQVRGVIALQIHSGGPTEVRFRKLVLEVLP